MAGRHKFLAHFPDGDVEITRFADMPELSESHLVG